jgi:hypothetical protein
VSKDIEEEPPLITKEGIELIGTMMKDLGFNAQWYKERRAHDIKWDFFSAATSLLFLLIVGAGLFYLVDNGRMDSSAFSTLLAVIVGAALKSIVQRTTIQ